MWLIVFGFAVATLLLAWLMFGYPIWLRFAGEGKGGAALTVPATLPRISVIVPCWNEEELIVRKYRNLAECDYPADKLEIVFADGGSRDSTVQLLRLRTRDDGRVRVVCCPTPGKINQLNHVLPDLSGEIVVVTDADARLAPDALKWLAASFAADSELAVAGAYATPRDGLEIERCYWNAQNRVRLLESRISHVSMVIACCYAFRRDLLARFPNDVVADDVYVAVLANTLGHHTTYCVQARVEELRTPRTQWEFLVHKFRKSNAVLREMLRFCYQLPNTVPAWKSILTTRLVQQLLLPVATVFWVALAATLANLGQVDLPMWGFVVLLFGLLAARRAVMSVELPAETEKFGLVTVVVAYVYTMGVLFATALTYLSFRQDSSYTKLSQRSNERPASKRKKASSVAPEVPQELIAGNAV